MSKAMFEMIAFGFENIVVFILNFPVCPAIPILFVWLLAETIWDLKERDIPHWFSIIPLATGLIHLAWVGNWLAALLMLIPILGTRISHPGRYVVVAAPIVFIVFLPEMLPLAIG